MGRHLGVFICLALLLCALQLVPTDLVNLFYDCDTFTVYAQGQSSNGVGAELDRAQARQAICGSCDGISVGTNLTLLQASQRLNMDIYDVMQFDNLTVVCGYSSLLKGGIVIDGKLVNVQLACCNGQTIIGSPLILGSY